MGGQLASRRSAEPADRDHVQLAVRQYAGDVAHREWTVMKQGSLDEPTWRQLDQLREFVGAVRPSIDPERTARDEALTPLREVYQARGERVSHVTEGRPLGSA